MNITLYIPEDKRDLYLRARAAGVPLSQMFVQMLESMPTLQPLPEYKIQCSPKKNSTT